MATDPYDALIMDHIKNVRNYRVLEVFDRQASGTNPLCGDEMLVYLKMHGERIADVSFQCTCCGISMASASIMTQMVKGRLAQDARALLHDVIATVTSRVESASSPASDERLALLETVKKFPARTRCAALPWATLESALDDRQDPAIVT